MHLLVLGVVADDRVARLRRDRRSKHAGEIERLAADHAVLLAPLLP